MHFCQWTSGWRGAVVLITLVTLGLSWWRGAEAYTWVKVHRVERLIEESESARLRGNFDEVSTKLKKAMALLRNHPSTLRAVARYQLEMHDLSALKTYAELVKTGKATADDKIAFAREAFRLGRPDMVESFFDELTRNPGNGSSASILALKATEAAWEGRRADALNLARAACKAPGDDGALAYAQSVLAKILLEEGAAERTDAKLRAVEGIELISELAMRQDSLGLESLDLLMSLSQNPQMAALFVHRDVDKLIDAANRHAQANPALKVGIWSLRLSADPASKSEIIQAFSRRFRDEASSALRLEAARWLNREKMHQMALELAEPSRLESEDWLVLFLDATAALGKWEEVLRVLSGKGKIPLAPAIRKLFELRGAMETRKNPDLVVFWRDIKIALRNENAGTKMYVAGYAERIGFPAEAANLYRELLDQNEGTLSAAGKLNHPRRLACYTGLLRTGAAAMKLEDLCQLMAAFARDFPEIDEVQNDNAYLQLLCGRDPVQAGKTADRLLKKNPELLAYRTTAALAALRRQQLSLPVSGVGHAINWNMAQTIMDDKVGQLLPRTVVPLPEPVRQKPATAVYDGWSIDWSTAQERYKAVYVAVMRAGGRTAEADEVAAKIQPQALRPEERKLAGLP